MLDTIPSSMANGGPEPRPCDAKVNKSYGIVHTVANSNVQTVVERGLLVVGPADVSRLVGRAGGELESDVVHQAPAFASAVADARMRRTSIGVVAAAVATDRGRTQRRSSLPS